MRLTAQADYAVVLLAAAAPDLLTAAKAVVERWDTPLWKHVEPTAAVLRAAIVKAEGGDA